MGRFSETNQSRLVIFVILFVCVSAKIDGSLVFPYEYRFHSVGTTSKTLTFGVLLPQNDTQPYSKHKAFPAIVAAVNYLKSLGDRGPLPGWNIELMYRDSQCSSTFGPLAAFDLHMVKVHVFLGPACDYALAPVARYSTVWNMPLLTGGGQNDHLDTKYPHYRTVTRMNGSFSHIGKMIIQVLKKFGWRFVGLLYHNHADRSLGHTSCHFSMGALFQALNKTSPYRDFDENKDNVNFKTVLQDIAKKARVIVMCASQDSVRNILLAAAELGMVQSGEYVFINIELFGSKNETIRPWYRDWDDHPGNNRAREAYNALLTVTSRTPDTDEYRKFSEEVREIAKSKYDYDYGNETVNTFVTAFYEAVILYATALNETLQDGFNITDGTVITSKMWNRTFLGITGNVSIDENGDRHADYSLLDMDPNTGFFEVVANYYGVSKQFVDVPGMSITWTGDRTEPPPDTPPCGFDGSQCPNEDPFPAYGIVSIVMCCLVVVLFISSIFIYRHYKLEAELASMNWKIRWSDLMYNGHQEKNRKISSRISLNRGSIPNSFSAETITESLSET